MRGPQSKIFTDREDLFQQLVGEGLQFASAFRAHISATKGRDGSIDAFIEIPIQAPSPFSDLTAPTIVECKDHDDRQPNFIRNVNAGWRKVEDKLRRESEAGWIGLFAPWRRARSYVYVTSAVLHQSARETLEASIRSFFDQLPAESSTSAA